MSLPVRGAWIEIAGNECQPLEEVGSLPVRGAWIEMSATSGAFSVVPSLPVRGAWIEIKNALTESQLFGGRSPCGERGLKFPYQWGVWVTAYVAPRAGSVD